MSPKAAKGGRAQWTSRSASNVHVWEGYRDENDRTAAGQVIEGHRVPWSARRVKDHAGTYDQQLSGVSAFSKTMNSVFRTLTMGLRRIVRDWIVRLSLAVVALDWIVVDWPTWFWVDVAAFVVMALAFRMDLRKDGSLGLPGA